MTRSKIHDQKGAALPAVLFVSALLLTGSAFLLSSVGNQSQNATDVLHETKAYYAAESGLQATINVLRFNGVDYAEADLSGNLSSVSVANGLVYNVDGVVPVGGESSYKVEVWDPDNSSTSTTFSTDAQFQGADGLWYSTRVFGDPLTNSTTISYTGVASAAYAHPVTGTSFGSFVVTNTGAGAAVTDFRFRIAYRMTLPRAGTRYFTGYIRPTLVADFDPTTLKYQLAGSEIRLCPTAACSTLLTDPTLSSVSPTTIYGSMDPLEPYRLAVRSTGFGPRNSRKMLEAVLQNNFFNDLGASAAIAMLGPNAVFNSGTSNNMEIMGGTVPSVGVSDPNGLADVLNDSRADDDHMFPPPVVFGDDLPEWQQSAANMDELVRQLRQTAINSGRYYPAGQSPPDWGNFDGANAGTGITFCDGDCDMGNANGGGILVVTGGFSASGNASFNGLVLVTGSAGVTRSGGGSQNGNFVGSIVVAPYDPLNLAAGFTQPRYDQNGGSDGTYNDTSLNDAFNGTQAITNFILGIAEK